MMTTSELEELLSRVESGMTTGDDADALRRHIKHLEIAARYFGDVDFVGDADATNQR